jgi:hypothetical protein
MDFSYIKIQLSYQTNIDTEIEEYLNQLLWNGKRNLCTYFQDIEKQKKHTQESITKLIEAAKHNFPVALYAQTRSAFVKIEVTKEHVNIYPLEPYCMKQGIDARQSQLDLEVYIKIALGLCENIAIHSLQTKQRYDE